MVNENDLRESRYRGLERAKTEKVSKRLYYSEEKRKKKLNADIGRVKGV